MHNVGFRSQEKSYIDEKITEVQKTVALMASDNGERERREEMREEFRRLNTTVQSVKEVLDKNEDKIGEIVMKVENLVSVYHNVSVFLSQVNQQDVQGESKKSGISKNNRFS